MSPGRIDFENWCLSAKAKGFPYFEVHCMQIGFLCPRLMMQKVLLLLCCAEPGLDGGVWVTKTIL